MGLFVLNKHKKQAADIHEQLGLEAAYNSIPHSIALLDRNDNVLYVNPYFSALFNIKLSDLMGQKITSFMHFNDENSGEPLHTILDVPELDGLTAVEAIEHECRLSLKNRQDVAVAMNITPIYMKRDERTMQAKLVMFENITERRALESQLRYVERTDILTHLLTRKSFENELNFIIQDSAKHGSVHTFAQVSIDAFDVVNDSLGHAAGDKMIGMVSTLIKKAAHREIDIAGRLGHQQFGIIFRERNIAQSVQDMELLRKAVERLQFNWNGSQFPISVSIGFRSFTGKNSSQQKVLAEAEVASQIAQRNGGNQLYAFKEEDAKQEKSQVNMKWAMTIKQALNEGRMKLWCQPIHALAHGEFEKPFSHYEVLIRMFNEEGGMVPPDEFIPAAEYYNLMPSIDKFVVIEVIKQLKIIKHADPAPVFAVNLSGQSLNDDAFLQFVINEVKNSGIDPKMICFEITEQVAVDDVSKLTDFLTELRELGASSSLDDFGTGVSSYGYLKSLPVDYLKIDGSFIKDIMTDEISWTMVQSITQVGHTIGLKIIAEYVENEEIIERLRSIGVEYGQGWGIAKPSKISEHILRH